MASSSPEHPAPGVPRRVLDYATVLLAPNPGAMTLDGTNTWLVGDPASDERIVIDPGPSDAAHLRAVREQGRITGVLLTHHHPDHTEGAAEFAELTGAPVRALDAELCADGAVSPAGFGAGPLGDGEVLEAAGVRLRVMATPGHTADSLCLHAEHAGVTALFSGDSILGRGTTVVAAEDGDLGSYLESLRALSRLAGNTWLLPGHGPEQPDARAAAAHYLEHRRQRLDQVRAALGELGGRGEPGEVVDIVYADVDPAVRPAAESTVRAQLRYLREVGELH
ncbi:Glyoxylase, beta-lactamase superfamily II [Actinopolyspora xinjiangensis]|uniref:Glyoxylase, beta-lactamase superfamily II n=1 Tax=Actinopolyspora xinjiangensis TaxID=405564 RepID=A0A1H0X2K2_9ACTN|nr:MBL fold metallo-hydrolase [Actinopolyspora xinjiangensis]SDP97069.1 Glyoxylase, beta-lactamase superfamily II [Actinopolyspora xinjiangensis]